MVSRVQQGDPSGNRAIEARVQRVSIDEDDEADEPGVRVTDDGDALETEVAPLEEPVADVMEFEDSEDGEVSALFGDKIQIRPQVKQLLDKYGTIPAEQLLQEVQDTNQLLSQQDESN